MSSIVEIYTDGSYNSTKQTGAWAAFLIINEKIKILNKVVSDSTHNRMELLAVIESIDYLIKEVIPFEIIYVYSDSQYVVNIPGRANKFKQMNYLTNKGISIRNADLVKKLINFLELYPIKLIKVKAHQKQRDAINYNREVDKLVRKLVRGIG